eukprot:CAMPEP_0113934468 /NCGR_PEP_ID=MMETSP1339-20121228/1794_1 /TAXON_ID=94617 /ORGANISM="Fibrocapsa japonica" /LENGTH=127 /DNA_ID=CAMNT_0000936287 /DNA_START=228 /DNA_END=611 /DNA_ORIENTATION=+ /assembly_acc=CAM_ASM_000762
MKKTGRPVSPHVFIYRFPPAAISSIMNRVTGVALYSGIAGVGLLSLAGVNLAPIVSTMAHCSLSPIAKFAVSYPLLYHYLGGIRHIVWDFNPSMLENKSVEQASYALIGGATVLAGGISLMTFEENS